MTDYTITTNFGAKDSLPSGNAGKVIKGSEFTTEFTNIQTAVNTKADTAGDTFTGAVNFSADVAVNTNTLFVDVSEDKVGIGTSSPAYKLDVTGSAQLSGGDLILRSDSTNADTQSIRFENSSEDTRSAYIRADYATNSSGNATSLVFGTNPSTSDGSNRMVIDSTGKVGIGTDSPDQKGHISGAGTQYLRVENTTNGVVTDFGTTSTGSTIINRSAHPVSFFTNAEERMRIDALGNVGIGTTSPASILSTAGTDTTAYSSSSVGGQNSLATLKIQNLATSANSFASIDFNTNNNRVVNRIVSSHGSSTTDGFLAFVTEGSGTPAERMRIDSSGNLLVGRTSDDYSIQGISLRNSPSTNSSIAALARDGSNVASLNRLTNDGTLLTFYKDSSQIGSIGTTNGYLQAGTEDTQLAYINSDKSIRPFLATGSNSNGNISLGASGARFKNIYLVNNPNVSSDQRLKENIADADDAGSTIDAIQVRKFDWIADGRHQSYGMVAQELAEVYPEAVNVPENSEDTLGIATGDLIPMLIKEVQSLRSRVAELENV